jgi:hypothetical protein
METPKEREREAKKSRRQQRSESEGARKRGFATTNVALHSGNNLALKNKKEFPFWKTHNRVVSGYSTYGGYIPNHNIHHSN